MLAECASALGALATPGDESDQAQAQDGHGIGLWFRHCGVDLQAGYAFSLFRSDRGVLPRLPRSGGLATSNYGLLP
jgi:hypothetical protein